MRGQNKVCLSRTPAMLSATGEADKGRNCSEHPLVVTEMHVPGTDLERSIWYPDGKLGVLTGNIKDLPLLYFIHSRGTMEFAREKEAKKTSAHGKPYKLPSTRKNFYFPQASILD